MIPLLKSIIVIIVGLSGGLAVGGGLVAFLTVLGIIPRLAQITKTGKHLVAYQLALIFGAILFSWVSLHTMHVHLPDVITAVYGVCAGIFVGLLAAALTEVLNVLPILSKRIGMETHIWWFLFALILGKVCGSLFQWIWFVPYAD